MRKAGSTPPSAPRLWRKAAGKASRKMPKLTKLTLYRGRKRRLEVCQVHSSTRARTCEGDRNSRIVDLRSTSSRQWTKTHRPPEGAGFRHQDERAQRRGEGGRSATGASASLKQIS